MCRLLCVATRGLVPHLAMSGFKRLTRHGRRRPEDRRGHRNGWGIGYFLPGRVRLVREFGDALASVRYDETAHMVGSNPDVKVLAAYLRSAVPAGTNDIREKMMPHSASDRSGREWLFVLDGKVGAENETGRPYAPEPVKETAGERLLREVLIRLPGGLYAPEKAREAALSAVKEVLLRTASAHDFEALNIALTDGHSVIAARFVSEESPVNELHVAKTPKAVVACSEPLEVEGWRWEPLPNRTAVVFDTSLNITRVGL